jgi:hypothetical protein
MAAGLGFKTFNTGDVLSAADVNGYLMQGILVFADATARDAAITSPEEGQFAFLKDTNVTTYYTGSAWANVDTTGMTNPMTTTGDVIYSSSGSTPARLGIGTAGQVLQVNSGATAPEWATASSGALTKVTSASFSAVADTGSTFDGIFTSTYANYIVIFKGYSSVDDTELSVQNRKGSTTHTGSDYYGGRWEVGYPANTLATSTSAQDKWQPITLRTLANNEALLNMTFTNVGTGSSVSTTFNSFGGGGWLAGTWIAGGAILTGLHNTTGLIFSVPTGTMTGTVYVYGVQN